jgi:hypothetical protein
MSARTIKTTAGVYLYSSSCVGPADLVDGVGAGGLAFFSADKDMRPYGYTLIGTAEITMQIVGTDELVQNKVEALRAEKSKVIGDAQNRATEIERQIQTLLAITHDRSAA